MDRMELSVAVSPLDTEVLCLERFAVVSVPKVAVRPKKGQTIVNK